MVIQLLVPTHAIKLADLKDKQVMLPEQLETSSMMV